MRMLADDISKLLQDLLPLLILGGLALLGRLVKRLGNSDKDAAQESQKMRRRVEETREVIRRQRQERQVGRQGIYQQKLPPAASRPQAHLPPAAARPQPQRPARAQPIRPMQVLRAGEVVALPPRPAPAPARPRPPQMVAPASRGEESIEQRHFHGERLGSGVQQEVKRMQTHIQVEDLQRVHHLEALKQLRTQLTARFDTGEAHVAHLLVDLSRRREALKGIIYSEILGLPKALRPETEIWDR